MLGRDFFGVFKISLHLSLVYILNLLSRSKGNANPSQNICLAFSVELTMYGRFNSTCSAVSEHPIWYQVPSPVLGIKRLRMLGARSQRQRSLLVERENQVSLISDDADDNIGAMKHWGGTLQSAKKKRRGHLG